MTCCRSVSPTLGPNLRVVILRVGVHSTNRAMTDYAALRWALGDECSDEQVARLAARLRQPAADKNDLELVNEHRIGEMNQRHKN